MSPSAASATRRPATEMRAAIVAATVRVIGRGGVAAVTHRAVAAEAGVSLSSTTYHFRSKAEIVEAALRSVVEGEVRRLSALSETMDGVDDVPTLARALGDWVGWQLAEDLAAVRTGYELTLEAARTPALQEVHAAWGAAAAALAATALARAGSARPEEDARVLVALVDGLRVTELARPRPGVADRVSALLERTMGALVSSPDHR